MERDRSGWTPIEYTAYKDNINDPRRYAKFHINTYGLIKIDGIYFFGTINNLDEKIRKRHIVYRMDRIKIKG